MSGNVREWVDTCDGATGDADACRLRGGGFDSNPTQLRCDADDAAARDTAAADIGFRCCLGG